MNAGAFSFCTVLGADHHYWHCLARASMGLISRSSEGSPGHSGLQSCPLQCLSQIILRWLFIAFFPLSFMFKGLLTSRTPPMPPSAAECRCRVLPSAPIVLLWTEQPESWIQICTKNNVKSHLKT